MCNGQAFPIRTYPSASYITALGYRCINSASIRNDGTRTSGPGVHDVNAAARPPGSVQAPMANGVQRAPYRWCLVMSLLDPAQQTLLRNQPAHGEVLACREQAPAGERASGLPADGWPRGHGSRRGLSLAREVVALPLHPNEGNGLRR